MNKKEFTITKELDGLRLDQALARFLDSRMQAVRLIQAGLVQVADTSKIKSSYRVEAGDIITLKGEVVKKEKEDPFKPYDFPVPVVYEDEFLLVVNKPAGLVVHPSPGHSHDTLVNALIHKLNPNVGSSNGPGLLHRLDKDVSGLLVLSKTQDSHTFLAKQFLNRKVQKVYWAVCYKPILFTDGRVETYIKRDPIDRKKFISHPKEGRKSVTFFKVLKKKELALIQCRLLTGRTHQARIHSLEISQGIVGDEVYARPQAVQSIKESCLLKKTQELNRIALHAVSLGFIHPHTKKEIDFHAPFPKVLEELLEY